MNDEPTKYPPLTQHYVDVAEYIAELEDRAGIPRPCPRCGRRVTCHKGVDGGWWVKCEHSFRTCGYITTRAVSWDDAWREHEQNCRKTEEAEG